VRKAARIKHVICMKLLQWEVDCAGTYRRGVYEGILVLGICREQLLAQERGVSDVCKEGNVDRVIGEMGEADRFDLGWWHCDIGSGDMKRKSNRAFSRYPLQITEMAVRLVPADGLPCGQNMATWLMYCTPYGSTEIACREIFCNTTKFAQASVCGPKRR
jgi:hypothetical protein